MLEETIKTALRTEYEKGRADAIAELTELAMLWRNTGEVNIKTFSTFLKDRGFSK